MLPAEVPLGREGVVLVACQLEVRNRPNLSIPSAYRAASTVYTFDRNAIVASVAVGPFVVALTRAGHLLRFDRATLALQTELLSARGAVVLGSGDAGSVLIGYQSGRIVRLDVATFALQTVASVPGIPLWVGATSALGAKLRVELRFGWADDVAPIVPMR